MSKSKSLLATLCTFAVVGLIGASAEPSSAMDSTSVTVSASVTPDCKFGMGPFVISLGALDTVNGVTNATNSVPLVITCNEGTNAASPIMLSFNDGKNHSDASAPENRAMIDNANKPSTYLSYTLSIEGGTPGSSELGTGAFPVGTYLGSATTASNMDSYSVNIYAFVQTSDMQIASTGTYSDSVGVTVTP